MAFRKLDLKKNTKVKVIQHYLRNFPEAGPNDIRDIYEGTLVVANTQFYRVRKEMREAGEKVGGEPRKTPAPKHTPPLDPKDVKGAGSGTPRKKSKPKKDERYEAMRLEIEYLRWLLDGEQKGFVERWLKGQALDAEK